MLKTHEHPTGAVSWMGRWKLPGVTAVQGRNALWLSTASKQPHLPHAPLWKGCVRLRTPLPLGSERRRCSLTPVSPSPRLSD